MGYGFWAANKNGDVQIDGKYQNLKYLTAGTWSLPAPDWPSNCTWSSHGECANKLNLVSFPEVTRPPVIGIRPPGDSDTHVWQNGLQPGSGVYNSTYVANCVYWSECPGKATDVDYIIFVPGEVSDVPSGQYGLAVWNAEGKLVYHNYDSWLRIISHTVFSNPMGGGCAAGVSGDGFDDNAKGDRIDISVEDAYNNYFVLRPQTTHYYRAEHIHEYQQRWDNPAMRRKDATTIEVEVCASYIQDQRNTVPDEDCRSVSNLTLIEINV